MIVVDTGVLVALLDADDKHHQRCREWYADADGPLIVPTPVMVETCYFIERDSDAATEADFLRSFDGLNGRHDRPSPLPGNSSSLSGGLHHRAVREREPWMPITRL